MSGHVYNWSQNENVHRADGPDGLVCFVEVSPGAFVAWSVRVGGANGCQVGRGQEGPKRVRVGELEDWWVEDWAKAVERAKQRAQEHANDIARWHRERIAAKTARLSGILERRDSQLCDQVARFGRVDAERVDAERARDAAREDLLSLECARVQQREHLIKERDAALAREAALVAALERCTHVIPTHRREYREAVKALAAHSKSAPKSAVVAAPYPPGSPGAEAVRTWLEPPAPSAEGELEPGDLSDEMHDRIDLWNAINDYATTCGGDPSKHVYGNTPRMDAVVAVERVFDRAQQRALTATSSADGELRAKCAYLIEYATAPKPWSETIDQRYWRLGGLSAELARALLARLDAPAGRDTAYRAKVAAFTAAFDRGRFLWASGTATLSHVDAMIDARRDLLADHPEADAEGGEP